MKFGLSIVMLVLALAAGAEIRTLENSKVRVEAVQYGTQYGLNVLAKDVGGKWKLVGYGQRDQAENPQLLDAFVVTDKDGKLYPIPLTRCILAAKGLKLEGANELVKLVVNVSLQNNGNPILDLELTRKGTAKLGSFMLTLPSPGQAIRNRWTTTNSSMAALGIP